MSKKPLSEMNDEELDRYAMSSNIIQLQDEVQALKKKMAKDNRDIDDWLLTQESRIKELEKNCKGTE